MAEPERDVVVAGAGEGGALARAHPLVPAERHLQDPGQAALAPRVQVEDRVRPRRLSLGVRVRFGKPEKDLDLKAEQIDRLPDLSCNFHATMKR